ncbi:hypothetical protein ACFW4K_08500 [Nocardiopsis alba]|uniref:hypothetical protein n=1 Tax=Nocardiopsis alba TaxID=53437 RepID=UPI00366FD53C
MATTLEPRRKPHHPAPHPREAEPRPLIPAPRPPTSADRARDTARREPVVLADALGEVLDTLLERSPEPDRP